MANPSPAPQPTVSLVEPMFGLPQGSLPLYGHDSTVQTVVGLGPTNQVAYQLSKANNTDVIANYRLELNLDVTAPSNSSTASDVNLSEFAPYSALQNVTLSVQNVFNTLDTNGIDLAVKNILWPWKPGARFDAATLIAPKYPSPYESRPYGGDTYNASGGVAWQGYYDLGPAQYFDHYYEVDLATGLPLNLNGVISQRIYAGVQYLGGNTRVIVPNLVFSPILGGNSNQALYTGTATTNGSGTATLTLDREGWFSQTSLAKQPAVTNWIPQFTTSFVTIGAGSNWTYEIPKSYQVLGLVFRFFDPGSNSPPTAPINECSIRVGSGITLFNGSGTSVLKHMYDTFDLFENALPYSTYAFDFAHNHAGETTNANAINTYVTNGCVVQFKLNNSGNSDQFGCYVSVYGLQYVNQGSGI